MRLVIELLQLLRNPKNKTIQNKKTPTKKTKENRKKAKKKEKQYNVVVDDDTSCLVKRKRFVPLSLYRQL